MSRRLPANVGAWVVIRYGEGVGPRGINPRDASRFLAGEIGRIIERCDDNGKYDVLVQLPVHPDGPGLDRKFYFRRSEIHVLPCGPDYLTATQVTPMEWWPTGAELRKHAREG